MKRKSIIDIKEQKGKDPIVCLTAYTAPIARAVDKYVDLLLVGDSLGMVLYDYENTLPVTLDQIIEHSKSVVGASEKACVIVDMPFGTYQGDSKQALNSAIRIMKESGSHAVKLEGGAEIVESIERILTAGIPVMGHLGLTPQSIYKFGTYSVRAKEEDEAAQLLEDAKAIEAAGCFSIVFEKIPADLAASVSAQLNIPTIGIGAGADCDGQVLVLHDMLGITKDFSPRFLRRYADLGDSIDGAVKQYITDVRNKDFPNENESY